MARIRQIALATAQRQLFLACCLSQKRYSAIIVVILSGVEREEGLPLLAPPREKPSMLSGHDIFDCPRTVNHEGFLSRHSLAFPFGFNLLGINDPRSSGSRDCPGSEVGSTGGACGEHEPSRPLRAPDLHAPLQAPELGAGGIEIGKLVG